MRFARSVVISVIIAVAVYGLWLGFKALVITPYRNTVAYNNGKVYDPLEAVMADRVRSDEGFVCPGATIYGGPGMGDWEVKRPTKVKVIKKYGTDAHFFSLNASQNILGVKVFDGQSDIDRLPERWLYSKDLRKKPDCGR